MRFDLPLLIVRRLLQKHHQSRISREVGRVEIDKDKIVTQEESGEPAPIDQVEERVEAEMKEIEGRAKERVAQGLQDEELEREARELKDEGNREKEEAKQN
jgi:hypothetical protein